MQWDAGRYAQDFSFVADYGRDVMALLDCAPGSRVLDLGCGNGTLTRALADAGFAASGMGASCELLAVARETHPDLVFFQADATDFPVPEPYDAVFSNAVLHWIPVGKQPDVLRCVRAALSDGGCFAFECGGSGNNALIHAALSQAFAERGLAYAMPFYFPTIGEYATLLEAAGFAVSFAVLFDRPTPLAGAGGMRDWLEMFMKTPFEGIDPAVRSAILDDAVERLRPTLCRDGRWTADYVRLRMKASKR